MGRFKFEHRIVLSYLILGGAWILFSDKFLAVSVKEAQLLTQIQTYKGWFYVFVTGFIFFFFLRSHLAHLRCTEQELADHQNNLRELVAYQTADLNKALDELKGKNEIINQQNEDLKETLSNLKKTQSQLLQAEKMISLGILTAGIAHEINNPLNHIIGGATSLEVQLKEENIPTIHFECALKNIKSGVEKASKIVSNLTQLSKNNWQKEETCDLNLLIDHSLAFALNEIGDRIHISRFFDKNVPLVRGNIGQLHQVIINILLNAAQAVEDKGYLFVQTKIEGDFVNVKIMDSGHGIQPDDLSRVIDPFYTTKAPGAGTGLGLSVAYTIIQAHKGNIEIKSDGKKGTTVEITLPIHDKEDTST